MVDLQIGHRNPCCQPFLKRCGGHLMSNAMGVEGMGAEDELGDVKPFQELVLAHHTHLPGFPVTTSIAAMSASLQFGVIGILFHNVGHHLQERKAPAAGLGKHTHQETRQLRHDLVLGNGEEVDGGGHVQDQLFKLGRVGAQGRSKWMGCHVPGRDGASIVGGGHWRLVTGDVGGEDERISSIEWFVFILEAGNGEKLAGRHDR